MRTSSADNLEVNLRTVSTAAPAGYEHADLKSDLEFAGMHRPDLRKMVRKHLTQVFARYADEMLEEREFFIRKAIGWILRDTSK